MKTVALFVTALAGTAVAASAGQPVATYTLSDINANYSTVSGMFTASTGSQSSGDFTRPAAGETASFDSGFATTTSSAYNIAIDVTGNNGTTALGTGSFTFSDVDGDLFMGTVSGNWSGNSGAIFFTGSLTNVTFDTSNGNGSFDGTSGDSASIPTGGPFVGSIVQLTFNFGGGFFTSNFTNQNTLVDAQLVPAPGAAAILGLTGLVATRRRRA